MHASQIIEELLPLDPIVGDRLLVLIHLSLEHDLVMDPSILLLSLPLFPLLTELVHPDVLGIAPEHHLL